ncbi:target of Myb protein 1 isoform X4 [Hypomesus transpacificus]|uniref:target of Myb protein 1 isoform X4 n=1 Tax=Hypomesus transpacificus TaxID=137520 RepID=UPI001F07BB34|nr:target of Myb protein 1 isoform X4 [Hypomesus transpacificus]
MDFLIGNPFSTAVGQRIERATCPSLQSEDWALNMEICDIINETEDGPKDAVRALKKRIVGNKNFREVMLTLTVLEACVKNCGPKLHVLVSNREFVEGVLVRCILPKNNPPQVLQDRVLSIIQAWADAFRSSPALTGVVSVYEDLRRRGLEFPMTELHGYSPILPPDRVRKLRADLVVVRGNLAMMSDILSHLEPGSANHKDSELLQQLYGVCKDVQDRIVELVPSLSEEHLIKELLVANDDINTTFTRYHRFEQQYSQNTTQQSPTYVNLIDLQSDVKPFNQSECAASPTYSHLNQYTVDSVSSQMTRLTTQADDSLLQKRSPSPTQSGLKAGAADLDHNTCKPEQILVSQTSVMDDIEKWLDVDEEEDLSEEGVTSEEFDRFLAERAQAAERLPSLKTSSNTKQSQP